MTKEMNFQVTRWVIFVVIAIAVTTPLILDRQGMLHGTSRLSESDILDWGAFVKKLREPGQGPGSELVKHVWEALPAPVRAAVPADAKKVNQGAFADALNDVLDKKGFYDPIAWKDRPLAPDAQEVLAKKEEDRSPTEVRLVNRRALEAAFPREVRRIHLLPTYSSDVVKGLYDAIDALPPRSPVLFSFDFDPGSEAELVPQARSMLTQCFRKNLRVVAITLYSVNSPPLMNEIVQEIAKNPEFATTIVEGKDYVVLSYNPGGAAAIINMAQDFYMTFPADHNGKPAKGQAATDGIATLKNFPVVITLSAGNLPDTWIGIGQDRYKFKLGLGCTAVMATDYYPRLPAGQLVGLVGGLGGAYQYECLVNTPGSATQRMLPQSIIHPLIILLVVIGNVMFFLEKRKK